VSLHAFTLIPDQDTGPFLEQLHAAGCRDAIFRVEDGVPLTHFFREAPTLQRAMATAARADCATGLDAVGVAGVANPTTGAGAVRARAAEHVRGGEYAPGGA
jgi:hypothetical protein